MENWAGLIPRVRAWLQAPAMAHTSVSVGHLLALSASAFVGVELFYWGAVLAMPGLHHLAGGNNG